MRRGRTGQRATAAGLIKIEVTSATRGPRQRLGAFGMVIVMRRGGRTRGRGRAGGAFAATI